MEKEILIVSITNDIHALAVRKYLNDNFNLKTRLLCVDGQAGKSIVTIDSKGNYLLTDDKGERFSLHSIGLIWWRRSKASQVNIEQYSESEQELINNDWGAFLKGILMSHYNGKWISHPVKTELSSNKIFQLDVANKLGFMIPRTLISNDPGAVFKFVNSVEKLIVKPLHGTKKKLLFTQFVNKENLNSESIEVVPAIYQEYIKGSIHLRVNVFGNNFYTAAIETDELDWRENLNVPIREYNLADIDKQRILRLLKKLELKMGIIDMKILPNGEIVWLEINPQGQFLFLEPITNQNLLHNFSKFIYGELRKTTHNNV